MSPLLYDLSFTGAKQGHKVVCSIIADYASTLTNQGRDELIQAIKLTYPQCTTSNTFPAPSPASQTNQPVTGTKM